MVRWVWFETHKHHGYGLVFASSCRESPAPRTLHVSVPQGTRCTIQCGIPDGSVVGGTPAPQGQPLKPGLPLLAVKGGGSSRPQARGHSPSCDFLTADNPISNLLIYVLEADDRADLSR